MESNLRPLTLGEILDRTIQLYRTNFLIFAGIYAVYAGVVMVLNLAQIGLTSWLIGPHPTVGLRVLSGTAGLVKGLLIFLFAGAVVAAINRAVAWVHLGAPATIRGAYKSILPRLGRSLWLMTLTTFYICAPLLLLLVVIPLGIFIIPGLSSAGAGSTAVIGFVALIFLLLVPWCIYAIVMGLRYSLAVPACVMENLKAREAIRRSIQLSKGARGRIFMLLLLVFIVAFGFGLLTQSFLVVLVIKHKGQIGPIPLAISQIIAFFTNTFLGPIYAAGLTLFYYDQRVRKEGYDIEWMMQAAGLNAPVMPPSAESPVAPGTPQEGQA
jgi:hypothetical protein